MSAVCHRAVLALALLLVVTSSALAHTGSVGYVQVRERSATWWVRIDLALRDLEPVLGLDHDGDGAITWGELRQRHDAIARYLAERVTLAADGVGCPLRAWRHAVAEHAGIAHAVAEAEVACAGRARALTVTYRVLHDVDADHRALLAVTADRVTLDAVLSERQPEATIRLDASPADSPRLASFRQYLREGVHHILAGVDHLLFLLTLLLPAVLVREGGRWSPVPSLHRALGTTVTVVTAFTVAHATTLCLAALGHLALPAAVVEPAIALTVVLAALNNLWPVVTRARAAMGFGLGLLHGLGFAGALAELGLPAGRHLEALVGFNLGVEAGQLAVVALVFPLLYALRARALYRPLVLRAASVVVAGVATWWLLERLPPGTIPAV
ncbi:MAG: HupE/UreJ family protein [Ectothiorhodospiraceae bacterium]|nr:HupE/UreJ family protein [Ectothiorhodospiraceae bacterium]